MRKIFISAVCLLLWAAAGASADTSQGLCPPAPGSPEDIIPVPYSYEMHDGVFILEPGTAFCIKGCEADGAADLASTLLDLPYGLVQTDRAAKADIIITVGDGHKGNDANVSDESYRIKVSPKKITIDAPSFAGAFYAVQSIIQMAEYGRVGECGGAGQSQAQSAIQCCTITDSPRFGYRGLHFDVSRHFRSKEFLMKQMDAMALLKLNRMHLHLTDGAGWRLEIDAYPRLTEFAAWRPYRRWTDWWNSERHYCESSTAGAYGGYYTKDDIREILEYAEKRHIEVIPEIEMPGHSDEVTAAYPWMSCNGEQYGNCDICPGKESTYGFLETVLTEVADLFPSGYIHIGGDEASKEAWKTCPDCRKRMEEERLENVDELQSYLIRRIEKFAHSLGKRIIGWDEILQGGLAPDATVMSWRGTEGGIEALKSGHDVIMTPGEYCYLNYTQDAPFKEPVSIGGYATLEKTYSYEPAEPGLDSGQLSHLLGVQGNVWAEYITDDQGAEYMYYPRAFAIAETGWSRPEAKDYADFRERALMMIDVLRDKGYNTFDLANEYGERKESLVPVEHLATGCEVIYGIPYNDKYPASGESSLTDGLLGGWSYGDGRWQGFLTDTDVTVDLGSMQPVHYIGATFMQILSAWVYLPEKVEISISDDGEDFRRVGTIYRDLSDKAEGLYFKTYSVVCNENCRYVRIHAYRQDKEGAWLFTDEIVVN